MKKSFHSVVFIFLIFLFTLGCNGKYQSREMKPIFDGKTLNGWTQRGGKALYTVENGAIVGTTVLNTPNSFLCTEKIYSDFTLELDFMVDERLNSGVQIRSNSIPDYRNGRVHGYQVEIDPSGKSYDGKQGKNLLEDGTEAPLEQPRSWTAGIYDEGRRGWLYPLTNKPAARKAFKHDQWNHLRVKAVGNSIMTWLNDVPAADLKDDMTAEGFIALQVHSSGTAGMQVRWKNIKIRELNAE